MRLALLMLSLALVACDSGYQRRQQCLVLSCSVACMNGTRDVRRCPLCTPFEAACAECRARCLELP